MYLAVLGTKYAHPRSVVLGKGQALVALRPASGGKESHPWPDLWGPLPHLPAVQAMRLPRGVPPGWFWEPACAHELLDRAADCAGTTAEGT